MGCSSMKSKQSRVCFDKTLETVQHKEEDVEIQNKSGLRAFKSLDYNNMAKVLENQQITSSPEPKGHKEQKIEEVPDVLY